MPGPGWAATADALIYVRTHVPGYTAGNQPGRMRGPLNNAQR